MAGKRYVFLRTTEEGMDELFKVADRLNEVALETGVSFVAIPDSITPMSREEAIEHLERLLARLRTEVVRCPHCGSETGFVLECPECFREGCRACMPAGRDKMCPECKEEGESKRGG